MLLQGAVLKKFQQILEKRNRHPFFLGVFEYLRSSAETNKHSCGNSEFEGFGESRAEREI